VTPPLAAVAAAHQQLNDVLTDLTDAQVAQPTLLPGWTRGHLLAHITDAARARARVVEHALRGKHVDMWIPGERDAIIETTASRTAAEHRAAVAEHAGHLDEVWAGVDDWSLPGFTSAVFTRWREVWIHLVDLDLGVRPAGWTADFSCHAVDFLQARLPTGVAAVATDLPRRWGTGIEVSGTVRDLAAWLAGRDAATPPVSAAALPDLGPWPANPQF
jgi:maleylpyruvate isomerase